MYTRAAIHELYLNLMVENRKNFERTGTKDYCTKGHISVGSRLRQSKL